jgi:Tfp pilus assembly protein PilX
MNFPARQRGAVLLIAIVLLALAGIITLLALNVGAFESRSTANDLRAKMVNEVAEAGLSQGFEFLMREHNDWLDDDAKWELCSGTDTKFPCGAAPAAVRATMYRYKGAAGSIANIDDNLDAYMLPLENPVSTVGNGYGVNYGVAPLLCRVAKPVAGDTSVKCATDVSLATKQRIGTFVSVARIPGETARATLTQTVGRYALLANAPNVPPILASGSVDLTGTLQIVTNPNGGGPGVPVSIWTRRDVAKTGTPNTCYADEFFRDGDKHGDAEIVGSTTKTIVCDTCECTGDKSLSYDKSGNAVDEGIDILDIDGNTAGAAGQVNRDVRPELNEFPCDLFEYTFGIKTWVDNTSPADYFCETRLPKSAYVPDWNQATSLMAYPDEAYLYTNAAHIIPGTPAATTFLAGSGKVVTAAYLDASASGIIWCQPGCDVGSNQTVGSPDHPVLLVIDGASRIQGRVFGLVFLRNGGPGPASASNGGSATLDMNAGAAVYGGIIVQGAVDKANGNAAVIYNADVLNALANDPANNRYATLPGAWTDMKSY